MNPHHVRFEREGDGLTARLDGETVRLLPAGPNSIRVRATPNRRFDDALPSALVDGALPTDASSEIEDGRAMLTVGLARAVLELEPGGLTPRLRLRFEHALTGEVLLEEQAPHVLWPNPRHWEAEGGDLWAVETRFRAWKDERFYGLGQQQHGLLDQKGCVIDLHQKNTEISVPFLLSSRGYGLLWNNPGIGRVELAANRTLFAMRATPQIDYVITVGETPAAILSDYTALTGRPPMMPDWVLGFWQCKLRYETQDELLAVAREHVARGHPLSCIVIDFFHWPAMGEWRFDPDEWPDPSGMTAQLRAMGVEPMVSVWPAVNANASTYEEMRARGYLLKSRRGAMDGMIFHDRTPDGRNPLLYYDATNPDARAYHLDKVRAGYLDHGFRSLWLDACEPELYPTHADNLRLHAGDGLAVANAYSALHVGGHAEQLAQEAPGGVMLSRSAWAGSQRHPLVVWSGDVHSSFEDLRVQVAAGLNMGLSGMPWWTTDIGGFSGGDVNDPAFHELLIRWFQWGTFCPVMRLHGFRRDASRDERFGREFSFGGAANEVWSFGPEVEEVLGRYLRMRERLRPYLASLAREAHETGLPLMRALMLEFPCDPHAWTVRDAYMLGADLLVAPVMEAGATSRDVYLPKGSEWRCAWTGESGQPGTVKTVHAPLDRIPLFLRDDRVLPIVPRER